MKDLFVTILVLGSMAKLDIVSISIEQRPDLET